MQATEPLGMGDRVRVDIEMGICNERGPQADSFVTAQRIAYDRMNEARPRDIHSLPMIHTCV